MADTPWVGSVDSKLYLQSGQFTTTLLTSADIGDVNTQPRGITFDGNNTPWADTFTEKLFLTSGQFSSTIKTEQNIGGVDVSITGISFDGTDTPWCGNDANKLYLTAGQFSSTILTSADITTVDTAPVGISFDGTNTPWAGSEADKLYLSTGQFSTSVVTSQSIGGVDNSVSGISFDGTNTPWCGNEAGKLYLNAGQFSSTILDSVDISGVDASVADICTNAVSARVSQSIVFVRELDNTIAFGQISSDVVVYSETLDNTISLVQNASNVVVYSEALDNTISFGQIASNVVVYSEALDNTISFGQLTVSANGTMVSLSNTLALGHTPASHTVAVLARIYSPQICSLISFTHTPDLDKVFGLAAAQACKLNLPRWIFASASKFFNTIASNNNLHFYIEGTTRQTEEQQKSIEFRMDGPSFTEPSKDVFIIDAEINMLWSFNQDDEDFHEVERIKGVLIDAMRDICIYRFGDGAYDDDSLVGTLKLVQDKKPAVRVNNFGQVRADVRLLQGTVAGSYRMIHSCE